MKNETGRTLSTEPYKGVRDFYPEDQRVQRFIFAAWRRVCERYGYEEYAASILEPTELYTSKTSDEIVNEQTYTFVDRGERSVTLRPEMTPSVARMVAGRRRELAFPLRWYSIPNCFRYERPQRGRVREFWQLNADIFGVSGIEADIEVIELADAIMKEFGALPNDYQIKINDRRLLAELPIEAIRLLDRKNKMDAHEFESAWSAITSTPLPTTPSDEAAKVLATLAERGVQNAVFDPTVVRGFDYYTGLVFEVFDTNPENPRSIFGGGRYDRLLELFGDELIPAFGFGLGDVTMRDFLETHELLPDFSADTRLLLCPIDSSWNNAATEIATTLRSAGIPTAVYYGDKKIGDQIKVAMKKRIPFVAGIGGEEVASGLLHLKELSTGTEEQLSYADVAVRLSR